MHGQLIVLKSHWCWPNKSLSFTKWRGRNFVGLVEFPSFSLTFTYMQKKCCSGTEVISFCVSVRPSVRPCDRVSVCLSLLKSAVSLEPFDWSAPNFQGPLISSHVIFGRVTQTPQPSGSGPDPKKAGFNQIYLLRGFWGVVFHLFGIGMTRQTKHWKQNYDLWPTARENGAGRRGWPGGRLKNFGFSI